MHWKLTHTCISFVFQTILFFTSTSPCIAREETVDDVLQGFENDSVLATQPGPTNPLSQNGSPELSAPHHRISAAITLGGIYAYHTHTPVSSNTELHGLSSLSSRLDVDIDMLFSNNFRAVVQGHGFYDTAFALQGREQYTRETLDYYEDELEFDEAYFRATIFPGSVFTIGRQIISPGKFDLLNVQSVFNPVNQRKPGLTTAAERLVPVNMSRLDYSFDQWRFTALSTHEFRENRYPAFGSDYYPFAFPLPRLESTGSTLKQQSYGFLAGTLVQGWDISLLLSSFLSERSLLGLKENTPLRQIDRHTLLAVSTDRAYESWLVKFETDISLNHHYYALDEQNISRVDTLAGVEYSGFDDSTIIFEVLFRHLSGFDISGLTTDEIFYKEGLAWSFLARKSFLNDLLSINFLLVNIGLDFSKGGFSKLAAGYALTDRITLNGGIITYREGDDYPFNNIANNDRVFINVKIQL